MTTLYIYNYFLIKNIDTKHRYCTTNNTVCIKEERTYIYIHPPVSSTYIILIINTKRSNHILLSYNKIKYTSANIILNRAVRKRKPNDFSGMNQNSRALIRDRFCPYPLPCRGDKALLQAQWWFGSVLSSDVENSSSARFP